MIESYLVVEAATAKLGAAALALGALEGVRLHNNEGLRLVVTAEAPTEAKMEALIGRVCALPGVTRARIVHQRMRNAV